MIIAMPNNQVVHRSDPKHTELTFTTFEKELRTHIVPIVDANYSVQANPHGRAIAGCRWRTARATGRVQVPRSVPVVRHPERR